LEGEGETRNPPQQLMWIVTEMGGEGEALRRREAGVLINEEGIRKLRSLSKRRREEVQAEGREIVMAEDTVTAEIIVNMTVIVIAIEERKEVGVVIVTTIMAMASASMTIEEEAEEVGTMTVIVIETEIEITRSVIVTEIESMITAKAEGGLTRRPIHLLL
jgi:hypothetical protein